ncbi:amino acid oxidase [Rothia sp. HMSC072E10]|uniref:amino acid oxidase n=1 Tax=Rothia sp. HMSC072E10 TaxID=1739448 RepID=UPI0008A15168|nr:amino acid oxidase [Rothia sp. HMSC072E10]OFQ34077.1 amino acid oxidase [Rothia sp. HMSC072E10]
MTQPISRRAVAKAGVWSAPVVAASVAVPAYAASKETPGVQYGVYVSVQNNGGYVGYASSNNTGTINPATPEAHFTATTNPDSDINWDDATSKPKYTTYVNGEGKFTPVTNSQTGANGAYMSSSGFWWSVPTKDTATGTGYIPGGSVTLAAGATFVTEVEYTVSASAQSLTKLGKINGQSWSPSSRQLTGKTTELVASAGQAKYLSVAQTAGTWTAEVPTVTQNSDGTYTFKGRIVYTTSKAYTMKQSGTKYYSQTNFMPAQLRFPANDGWISYKQASSVQVANLTYSSNGATGSESVSGQATTAQINP